jgi:NAD(P)-dependent dehydrogenase (short-subunit alcohol dehydrogenase family)
MPNVLITGANRGIGLEFARQYAADGWDVIATARHSSAELASLGVQVEQLDLADAEAVAGFADKVEGPLDLFIANAGTNLPMEGKSADDARAWQAMMLVNAIAPYMLGRALLPAMSGGGKMIAISSGMGSIGDIGGGWCRTGRPRPRSTWRGAASRSKPGRAASPAFCSAPAG